MSELLFMKNRWDLVVVMGRDCGVGVALMHPEGPSALVQLSEMSHVCYTVFCPLRLSSSPNLGSGLQRVT